MLDPEVQWQAWQQRAEEAEARVAELEEAVGQADIILSDATAALAHDDEGYRVRDFIRIWRARFLVHPDAEE
jgi:hypothetical protein